MLPPPPGQFVTEKIAWSSEGYMAIYRYETEDVITSTTVIFVQAAKEV